MCCVWLCYFMCSDLLCCVILVCAVWLCPVALCVVVWCVASCLWVGWGGGLWFVVLQCCALCMVICVVFCPLVFFFCVCVQFSWTKDFRTTAKTWFMSSGKSICEPIPLRYRTQRRFSSHQISRARWWIFNTEGTTCWLWLVLARPVVICVGQQGWLVVSNDLKSEGHQSTHGFGG